MFATRQLLEIVYERREELRGRQTRGDGGIGDGLVAGDVDWVGMIGELGLQVVNCRL